MARRTLSEQEKQHKRGWILQCSAKLIGERGYEGTSMSDIAQAAELSTGTLYLYFPSKQDIYLKLRALALEELDHAFDDALALPAPDIRTRLCLMFYSYINFYKSSYAYYRIIVEGAPDVDRECAEALALEERGVSILKRLEAPLIEGVMHGAIKPCDTFKTVASIWAMTDGVLTMPRRVSMEAMGDQLQAYYSNAMDVMLNGILA